MVNQEEKKEAIKPIIVPKYNENSDPKKRGFIQKLKQRKQEKKKKQELEDKGKKAKLLRQTPSILPFLQIHDDYILLKDGVMDIFQIESKDLYSRNDEDLKFLLMARSRFFRSYFESIKEVAMNFPSNTEKQKAYWRKKRERTDDPLRLKFIDRKLFELEFLEKERTNREFFLFVYADNVHQLEERKKQIIRGMQQSFPLKELSIEKKEDVLFMLNNPNTKL
ncbi:hypothetical protein ACFSCZ_00535 [Siminovitchia sediminis]|uniref:Ycf1 n=1 Tax=Siminovitchia sediminis TaxID=1274353 RepID=A0ABW4KGE1_9BACI